MSTSIVLADDEPILRTIYAEALRRAGFQVQEASDGREALALIAADAPALLILDAWMPDVNGFEVLDSLRHDPSAMGTKIVMFSNLDDSDSRLEGFSSGLTGLVGQGDHAGRVRRQRPGPARRRPVVVLTRPHPPGPGP